VVPSQAIVLLFTGYDTVYPHLAGTTDQVGQEDATSFLTKVIAYIVGAAFATLIELRVDVVEVITGRSSHLAEAVLVVFCCIWLANVPVHGLSLLLIARGRQNAFIWLVGAEATANLVLTIVFALTIGPIGPAYATLVTIVVSNVIIFPHVVRHEFPEHTARRISLEALAAMVIGGTSAALFASLAFEIGGTDWSRLVIGLALGGTASGALGLLLLRQHGRAMLTSMFRGSGRA
jgi:O-antigen/teichoic acid export membrane protein